MPDDTAARLNEALKVNDTVAFLHALDEIVHVRGTAEIASARGMSVETLAQEVCPDSQPRFDTIRSVCGALGGRLVACLFTPDYFVC